MTTIEFLSLIKNKNANIYSPADNNTINTANMNLQQIHAAMLPVFLQDLYKHTNCINLGSSYIFGPKETERGVKYPIPSIFNINKEMCGNTKLYGKTVFGKNDLFWFATDAMGNCVMLDNLTLSVLRKYENPYRAMIDCLIIGKI
ncbi:MAG: hypothetical protein IKN73_02720 [Alphaproteobacteria bacterium]|nr:hypothetical protein [Alphaproteobacteria bacterium]